jgi:tRNA/tmRNA/rRNA uracil-C5-methylase (TrmA/RlmC/RlmD family)
VGRRLVVECGNVAHGGSVVARHEGVVVFVRHALPGERVVAEVTEGADGDRFLRADAVEVLRASADRVEPPCPFAGPGRCGGCDFQHVAVAAQRALKATVVEEQLRRLAGLQVEVTVEPVPGDADGLDWRTRVQWSVAADGTPGLLRHRSHEVVAVDDCRIAHRGLPPPVVGQPAGRRRGGVSGPAGTAASREHIETIVSGSGEQLRLTTDRRGVVHADGPPVLHERAAGRDWRVTGSGFWQVHPGAADALVAAVLEGLRPRAGERALDLYAGVGLFSAALAEAVGPTGRVLAVESDERAVADARTNLADLPAAAVLGARVDRSLADLEPADLVVLDPPRSGARRDVVAAVGALGPRAVGYVACDPAALARDVAYFADQGYGLRSLRAFDLFPMTHHVECVAVLTPA